MQGDLREQPALHGHVNLPPPPQRQKWARNDFNHESKLPTGPRHSAPEPPLLAARCASFPLFWGPSGPCPPRYNPHPTARSTDPTGTRKGAHRRQRDNNQTQATQRYRSNGWGSLKPHGLTWDVDVSAFMVRHLAPVPLSRRNVCLLHQKSPRHDPFTPARLTGTLRGTNRLRGGKCPEEETPKLEETSPFYLRPFPTFLLVSQGAVISPFFPSSYNTPSPQSDLPSRMLGGGKGGRQNQTRRSR